MSDLAIPFNKPFIIGAELKHIQSAVAASWIAGDGAFSRRCSEFLASRYKLGRALMTSSCTDALEMIALLLDIGPGDEVLIPSFTFVSTANAFALRGARVVFVDSQRNHPNIDPIDVERKITPRTKAVVAVHYGGTACPMEELSRIAKQTGISLVEDCAHSIDASYKSQPLGSFGRLSAFSFHETKNIISGEGGLLAVNDASLKKAAEIVWQKGTNRQAFSRGEVNKYEWVSLGSSFLASEITAAFLWGQLEHIDKIQERRIMLWKSYEEQLRPMAQAGLFEILEVPAYANINGHLFYLVCSSENQRVRLLQHLRDHKIGAVFHYVALHASPFARAHCPSPSLPNAERYATCLIRLPLYYELSLEDVSRVSNALVEFFESKP